jgi:hypothetical protein
VAQGLEEVKPGTDTGQRDSAQGIGFPSPGGARSQSEVMVVFIDAHRGTYEVEQFGLFDICRGTMMSD